MFTWLSCITDHNMLQLPFGPAHVCNVSLCLTSRPSLRPELQWGQRSLPGHPVEGSGLHRSEHSHRIFCGHGQEGLIRVCYSEPGSCEPPLPAGERWQWVIHHWKFGLEASCHTVKMFPLFPWLPAGDWSGGRWNLRVQSLYCQCKRCRKTFPVVWAGLCQSSAR